MDNATRLRIIVALAVQASVFTFTALMLMPGYAIAFSAVAALICGLIAAFTTHLILKTIVPAAVVETDDRQWPNIGQVHIPKPDTRSDYDRARPLR